MKLTVHRFNRIRLGVGLASLAAALLCPAGARAQEMALPVAVQIQVFTRMLAFDRELPSRAGDQIVIGILHQSRYRASQLAKEDVKRALNGAGIEITGIPVSYVSLDYTDYRTLGRSLSDLGVDVLYIAPLRTVDVSEITALSRARGILTCSGVVAYLYDGVAIGLSIRKNRPLLMVNLSASRAEGADFSSELLKLAEIVETESS